MNLQVHIREARDLLAADSDGFSDPYVLLQLGSSKRKTSVVLNSLDPFWNEKFSFTVGDLEEELVVTIWDQDLFADDFLGQLNIRVSAVLAAEGHTLPLKWYPLQKSHKKSRTPVSGEILLSVCLCRKHDSPALSVHEAEPNQQTLQSINDSISGCSGLDSLKSSDVYSSECGSLADSLDKNDSLHNPDHQVQATDEGTQRTTGLLCREEHENVMQSLFSDEDDPEYSGGSSSKLPDPLPGGILLDEKYSVSPKVLNAILFKPESEFYKDLFTMQNATNVEYSPWGKSDEGLLHRVVRYTKAATLLVKAIDVTEYHSYIRADTGCYAVLESVSTPDVPYGSYFRTEILFIMTPLSDLPSGKVGAHFTISWRINFLKSTVMKSLIEKKAKEGLEDSFNQFTALLSKYALPVNGSTERLLEYSQPVNGSKDQLKMSMQKVLKLNSQWELASQCFGNIPILCTVIILLLVLLHACMTQPNKLEGLEFWVLDMPDSLTEIIVTATVVLLAQHLVRKVQHFVRFRQVAFLTVGDQGVKAIGDGWLLSVALVEGVCLAPVKSSCQSDPYVVFNCNGQTRTSSIKMHSLNPQWQEIFEFDATEDLPSTMEVEVFDFDGSFAESVSLGHAEINFLKCGFDELADIWVPLDGRHARLFGSRIHLRLFLKYTKEHDNAIQYIAKIEREAGIKILRHSPERNSLFQKTFSLPSEEFLVDEFACALKRTVPIPGRLFLSPRMLGFNSHYFGRKTRFSFIWEDIEEIKQESLVQFAGSSFSPSLLICTKKGRANIASQYAKKLDSQGRLHFQFQSFAKFGSACRCKNKKKRVCLGIQFLVYIRYMLGEKVVCFKQFSPLKSSRKLLKQYPYH